MKPAKICALLLTAALIAFGSWALIQSPSQKLDPEIETIVPTMRVEDSPLSTATPEHQAPPIRSSPSEHTTDQLPEEAPKSSTPLPARGKELRDLLRTMLVRDQIALLGRHLDGGALLERMAVFFPHSIEVAEQSPLYNPRGIKLSVDSQESLRKILAYWEQVLSTRQRLIREIETDAIKRGLIKAEPTDADGSNITADFYKRDDFFLRKRTEREFNGTILTYIFGDTMLPDRDLLLTEQSQLIAQAEEDLVRFFSGF